MIKVYVPPPPYGLLCLIKKAIVSIFGGLPFHSTLTVVMEPFHMYDVTYHFNSISLNYFSLDSFILTLITIVACSKIFNLV